MFIRRVSTAAVIDRVTGGGDTQELYILLHRFEQRQGAADQWCDFRFLAGEVHTDLFDALCERAIQWSDDRFGTAQFFDLNIFESLRFEMTLQFLQNVIGVLFGHETEIHFCHGFGGQHGLHAFFHISCKEPGDVGGR